MEPMQLSNTDHGQLMAQVHQNNFGARDVCFKIFKNYSFAESEEIFKLFIKKEVVGAKLWTLYKDNCQGDLSRMVQRLRMTE